MSVQQALSYTITSPSYDKMTPWYFQLPIAPCLQGNVASFDIVRLATISQYHYCIVLGH